MFHRLLKESLKGRCSNSHIEVQMILDWRCVICECTSAAQYILSSQFLGELLTYLDSWEQSVSQRKGPFSAAERKQMILSDITLNGIRMTGMSHLMTFVVTYIIAAKSFMELIPYIFQIDLFSQWEIKSRRPRKVFWMSTAKRKHEWQPYCVWIFEEHSNSSDHRFNTCQRHHQ